MSDRGITGAIYVLNNKEDWADMVKDFLTSEGVKRDGKFYLEQRGIIVDAICLSSEEIEELLGKALYLTTARYDYLISRMEQDILDAARELERDPSSRRAIMYKPDWYWGGAKQHVNCILTYQFMATGHSVDLFVGMRSSDAFNAFPVDWSTSCMILKKVVAEMNGRAGQLEPGRVVFMMANMHIKVDDEETILSDMCE